MLETRHSSGEIDYPVEGYLLRWGGHGLEIQTTEYQATKLQLTWDQLLALAQRSGWEKGECGKVAEG